MCKSFTFSNQKSERILAFDKACLCNVLKYITLGGTNAGGHWVFEERLTDENISALPLRQGSATAIATPNLADTKWPGLLDGGPTKSRVADLNARFFPPHQHVIGPDILDLSEYPNDAMSQL